MLATPPSTAASMAAAPRACGALRVPAPGPAPPPARGLHVPRRSVGLAPDEVGVSARHREEVPADEERRPRDGPAGDCVARGDLRELVAAAVAHRRHAAPPGRPRP